MNRTYAGKLAGTFLLFMLLVPAAVVWIGPDLPPGNGSGAIVKLTVLCAVVGLVAVSAIGWWTSEWLRYTRRVEEFLNSLPMEGKALVAGPPELNGLMFESTAMAGRVRSLVEQVRLESSRRETILACIADGVLAVDHNLKVVFCNNAFTQAFGMRLTNAEGRPLLEVVREPLLRDLLERVVQEGDTVNDRFQLPSAAGRWFEARALPFEPLARRSAVVVLHDITDIQRQEQMRKDFVADVSHELRTPLAAIRGYAETLLDGGLEDGENNRKFVEIIHAHAIRLALIASDLLILSSLDSESGSPAPPVSVDVLEVIESAVNTVTVAAATRKIAIDTSGCHRCCILGVRFRLEQAVVNLLDNAVKFNREGGEVRIQCQQLTEGSVIKLEISDTGIGIPSGDIERIFERFYRVDKARSRTAGGTGLGLPIVKEVISRMGGSVSVESQLGRGARFTILLAAA